ncbi:FUSC family protein [Micromonospora sp. NPDC094482]|uniref:FUSC family protein n=1 Tax=unclassified Micromonospora TaxID=2617518 RepID=UPI003332DE69
MADDRPATEPERSSLGDVAERGGQRMEEARRRGGEAGKIRLRQLEITLVIALQSGLAAALAALIAQNLLGPGAHVFAPAAAVATIASAIGQRARRTFELLGGVGLGVIIGDLLRAGLGSGPWQTGLVVGLAIATALLVAGRGGQLVGQAGGTAVLISTLAPMERGLELPRIFDALVGSIVGLVVVALLVPVNPIRVLDRAAAPVYDAVGGQLHELSAALRRRDAEGAVQVLERVRSLDGDIGRLNEALSGADEVVTLAPIRWHRREQYHQYARSAEHLERMALDTRALARWSATALQYQEPVPDELTAAIARLGDAVRAMRQECRAGEQPGQARSLTLEAANLAGRAWAQGVRTFGDAIVTGLRTAASDLLRSGGCEPEEANRLVRTAAGAGERAIHPPLRRQLQRTARQNFVTGAGARVRRAKRRSTLRGRSGRARENSRAGLPGRGGPAR